MIWVANGNTVMFYFSHRTKTLNTIITQNSFRGTVSVTKSLFSSEKTQGTVHTFHTPEYRLYIDFTGEGH